MLSLSRPEEAWWWILPCLLPGFLVLELDKGVASRAQGAGQVAR